MLRPLAFAAALLLCGCWVGERFYTDAEAVAAISAGLYRSISPDGEVREMRVSILPNGLTRLSGDDEEFDVVGFTPLAGREERFVAWLFPETDREDGLAYGLLERHGDEFLLFSPACEPTQALARAAGAEIVPNSKIMMCRFPDRQSLESALRQLEYSPSEAARIVPVT